MLFGRKKHVEEVDEAPRTELEAVAAEVVELPPVPRGDGYGRRSVAEQRDWLLSAVEPLPPFGMTVLEAVGQSLCEDANADQNIPAVALADAPGWAVRAATTTGASADTPVVHPLAGSIGVGQTATGETPEGTCVRICAGGPMPAGTDAVVPLAEGRHTPGDDDVHLTRAVSPGEGVRAVGSDVTEGDALLSAGAVLHPRTVGMIAAAGIDRVFVRPRPRVVVLATGEELVEPGLPLRHPSDTYDVNSFLVASAARAEQAQVYRVGAYTADATVMRDVISDQLIRSDLIVTTGGMDADSDLVRRVMPQLGETDFCQVALDPGGTVGFGRMGLDRVPMVMLPGEPFTAYIAFQLFVRPLIRRLMGTSPEIPATEYAIASSIVRSSAGVETWRCGIVEETVGGRRMVEPLPGESLRHLGDLAQANALIRVAPEVETVQAGHRVEILTLGHR